MKFLFWLAQKIDGEIISADSMQIYKGMDIATAKITKEEKKNVKHHLIDFLEVEEEFSVAQYVNMAKKTIDSIFKKEKIPIIVGGTGLYIDSLINGINFKKETKDLDLREKLKKELEEKGIDFIFEKLKKLDPNYARTLHKNNTKRVLRAIEICILTNSTIEKYIEKNNSKQKNFCTLKIGLNFKNRTFLYRNIEKRVDLMLKNGLLEEIKKITYKNPSKTAMQAIGYKEFIKYFEGEISLEDAILNLKQNSRKYAKRQITWFKRDKKINWFYWDDEKESLIKKDILKLAEVFLK